MDLESKDIEQREQLEPLLWTFNSIRTTAVIVSILKKSRSPRHYLLHKKVVPLAKQLEWRAKVALERLHNEKSFLKKGCRNLSMQSEDKPRQVCVTNSNLNLQVTTARTIWNPVCVSLVGARAHLFSSSMLLFAHIAFLLFDRHSDTTTDTRLHPQRPVLLSSITFFFFFFFLAPRTSLQSVLTS